MRRSLVLVAAAGLLAGIAAMAVGPSRVAAANSVIVDSAACQQATLGGDDSSSGQTPLGFDATFFGPTYSQVYVNSNGNVTFGGPMTSYDPFGLNSSTGRPVIAPFFADVDMTGAGSGIVHYGNGGGSAWYTDSLGTHRAFCVDWGTSQTDGSLTGVGYYDAHTDKLNAFQMILVDRSDATGVPGDFDIVFNYQSIQWETGDVSGGTGGLGGNSARVGYSDGSGSAGTFAELPGSGVPGSFLDSNVNTGLANTSNSLSLPSGRWVFPVRSGSAPTGGSISGMVGRLNDGAFPIPGAPVQACPSVGACRVTITDSLGNYTIPFLPDGDYTMTAFPPAGSNLVPASAVATVSGGGNVTGFELHINGPHPLPPGAWVHSPAGDYYTGEVPRLFASSDSLLHMTGCPNGTATFELTSVNQRTGDPMTAGGTLAESPVGSGDYHGVIHSLFPIHGTADLLATFTCPGPTTDWSGFTAYVDPGGIVLDMTDTPIPAATVVLLRSDTFTGPFSVVPNGSGIMSPSNRSNPDTTTVQGGFGWEVIGGYYRVEALAPGCHNPTNPSNPAVYSPVMTVPPPVLTLTLYLDCSGGADTTAPTVDIATDPLVIEGNTAGGWTGTLTTAMAGVSASDPDDAASDLVITNDAAALLPLGDNSVTWTATDPAGNHGSATGTVRIVDTNPPIITCPGPVTAVYGSSVSLGTPVVSDIVDSSPTVTNNAPSSFPAGVTSVTWTATDHSLNSSTCTQSVTVHAPTSLQQNGQMIVNPGSKLLIGAQLSSTAASCRSGQTITFWLDRDPTTGAAGAYALGSATTDSSGQATRQLMTTGWQEGTYTVGALFSGTVGCDASSDLEGTVTVASPGDAASGGGWYTLAGSGRSNFGFVVQHMPDGSYKGQVLLINTDKWRLKGTPDSYSKSGHTGTVTGTGTLYYWSQSANGGLGAWIVSQSNVSFSMTFVDNGTSQKTNPDKFGVVINHAVVSPPEPSTLPNSAPVAIKGGDIRVK